MTELLYIINFIEKNIYDNTVEKYFKKLIINDKNILKKYYKKLLIVIYYSFFKNNNAVGQDGQMRSFMSDKFSISAAGIGIALS